MQWLQGVRHSSCRRLHAVRRAVHAQYHTMLRIKPVQACATKAQPSSTCTHHYITRVRSITTSRTAALGSSSSNQPSTEAESSYSRPSTASDSAVSTVATISAIAASTAMLAGAADAQVLDASQVHSLADALRPLLTFITFLYIVRIPMTWYPNLDPKEFPWNLAVGPTEPVLSVTRKVIPLVGGVDITPIVWVGLLSFFNEILLGPQGLLVLIERQGGI